MRALYEDTSLSVGIKTLVGIAVAIASAVAMYYSLMQEIEVAKELPLQSPDDQIEIVLDNDAWILCRYHRACQDLPTASRFYRGQGIWDDRTG